MTNHPDSMAAVEIRNPGRDGELSPVTRPVPSAGPGEVLIRVAAAGVNRPDCLQRRGLYPPPAGASDLPGLEVAGRIAALGPGVTDWQPDDAVCALLSGGGYAEYCVAPAGQCLPVPHGLGMVQAAALPETYFTVWTNLFDRGRLQAGDLVLIHGGASGIGTTAIQLARAFGARVFATAGNDDKTALCRRLGAEIAVNYRAQDFAEVVRDATDRRGVDIILDIVGGSYYESNEKLLAPDGRLVVIGVLGGTNAEINLARILTKRLTITGSTLRARDTATKAAIAESLLANVWPKLQAGECLPVIQQELPLASAGQAHALLEANAAMGKIVLKVGDDI